MTISLLKAKNRFNLCFIFLKAPSGASTLIVGWVTNGIGQKSAGNQASMFNAILSIRTILFRLHDQSHEICSFSIYVHGSLELFQLSHFESFLRDMYSSLIKATAEMIKGLIFARLNSIYFSWQIHCFAASSPSFHQWTWLSVSCGRG